MDDPIRPGEEFVQDDHLTEYCEVPCGTCEACRLSHAKMWSDRCTIEASQYPDRRNWFLTLTYKEPAQDESKAEFTWFIKRLRAFMDKPGIRFFACGEYGEKTGRFHMHAILFNCPFDDLILFQKDSDGTKWYTSPVVSKAWPKGIHLISEMTPGNAAYVARYTLKKTAEKSGWIHMSRNPGIGAQWFKDHYVQIFKDWKVYIPGRPGVTANPPPYFSKLVDKHGDDAQDRKALNQERAIRDKKTKKHIYHQPDDESYNDLMRKKAKSHRLRILKKESLR